MVDSPLEPNQSVVAQIAKLRIPENFQRKISILRYLKIAPCATERGGRSAKPPRHRSDSQISLQQSLRPASLQPVPSDLENAKSNRADTSKRCVSRSAIHRVAAKCARCKSRPFPAGHAPVSKTQARRPIRSASGCVAARAVHLRRWKGCAGQSRS